MIQKHKSVDKSGIVKKSHIHGHHLSSKLFDHVISKSYDNGKNRSFSIDLNSTAILKQQESDPVLSNSIGKVIGFRKSIENSTSNAFQYIRKYSKIRTTKMHKPKLGYSVSDNVNVANLKFPKTELHSPSADPGMCSGFIELNLKNNNQKNSYSTHYT